MRIVVFSENQPGNAAGSSLITSDSITID
jgi:hypothetical protein